MGNITLPHRLSAQDLGVHITPSLNFSEHYQCITNIALKTLGFIKRFTADFKTLPALRLLYCALDRPHLEYASIIWSPHQYKYQLMLERVQHKFLRYAAFKSGQPMARDNHDYSQVMNRL
ncbi:hypothetical protein KPH14_007662 [Odynerus spinipes]|uniref:RNA-directed DNA polymerase from mobile element jockey n=1 Tax=Odynerus spinipes TaxID=1348599 RepID=A0AAD9R8X7_9HYME|nr:hypothetical protein KPH14_007662 [Odynerus spinipes]